MAFLLAGAFTCFFLVTAGYFYLEHSIKETEETISDVPYEFSGPENKSVLFLIEEKQLFFYFDFSETTVYISEISTSESEREADYTIRAEREFLGDLIDSVGGISLTVSGETLRYTGSQVLEMTDNRMNEGEMEENTVLRALVDKIAKNGLTIADFKMMIEETETDLTLPECYFWEGYMRSLFSNAVFTDLAQLEKIAKEEK